MSHFTPVSSTVEDTQPPMRIGNHRIIRAYQLIEDDECVAPKLDPARLLLAPRPWTTTAIGAGKNRRMLSHSNIGQHADEAQLLSDFPAASAQATKVTSIVTPKDMNEYLEKMEVVRKECRASGLVAVYHYTRKDVVPLIFEYGLRMSTQGQGDGGVYFSTLSPSSYDLGTSAYESNIISDCFGEERMAEYKGKGLLDVCLVYAIDPRVLEQAPGGRRHAKMVPKIFFEALGKARSTQEYYLRPDMLMAAFDLGPTPQFLKSLERERNGGNIVVQRQRSKSKAVPSGGIGINRDSFVIPGRDSAEQEILVERRRDEETVKEIEGTVVKGTEQSKASSQLPGTDDGVGGAFVDDGEGSSRNSNGSVAQARRKKPSKMRSKSSNKSKSFEL